MGAQVEIVLWVVITVALPAMVADNSLAFFTEAQTGTVLAAGTLGSVVGLICHRPPRTTPPRTTYSPVSPLSSSPSLDQSDNTSLLRRGAVRDAQ